VRLKGERYWTLREARAAVEAEIAFEASKEKVE